MTLWDARLRRGLEGAEDFAGGVEELDWGAVGGCG